MSVYGSGSYRIVRRHTITLGLTNGESVTGQLENFVSDAPELVLEQGGGARQRVPSLEVAYVGFHRADGEAPPIPAAAAETFKIHLIGGQVLAVLACSPFGGKSSGFAAIPRDPNSPYRELYFYSRAVRLREKDEPIGSMLVSSGALHPDALDHAISAQRAHQNTPIGKLLVETLNVSEMDIVRTIALQKQSNQRIGDLLIEEGLASREQIDWALAEQQRRKSKRIGEVLLDLNIVSELTLTRTLARKFDLRFVDLDASPPDFEAAKAFSKDIIARHRILPIERTAKALVVAISDPMALQGIDELRFSDRRLEEVMATPSALKRRIDEFLGASPMDLPQVFDGALELTLKRLGDAPTPIIEDADEVSSEADPADSATIALVNQLFADAYRRGASDIHIEPNGRDEDTEIRFRIDGECVASQSLPARHRNAVVARIKIMAHLDIAERRKPQDGKIRYRLPDHRIELRVATLPTVNGDEDVVLRIVAANRPIKMADLQLSKRNLHELDRIIRRPNGLILCVGPSGSGKTTAVHSLLGELNTVNTKIWTAEDPVEITQKGLRQMQMNPRVGLTFATAVRAFLRADPDVILVGEIRDQETAALGIEASLTGHLVFSTLHTNNAPESVSRLLDMGLDPFNFADALLAVLAQRLVRRLCQDCKTQAQASSDEQQALLEAYGAEEFTRDFSPVSSGKLRLWRASGCTACAGTGYRGRVALHELLVSDDEIKSAVVRRAPVAELRKLARATGMRTLVQDGVEKALRGETDTKQVLAACQ